MITQSSPVTRSPTRVPKLRDQLTLGYALVHLRVGDEANALPTSDDTPMGGPPPADTPQARAAKTAALKRALAHAKYKADAEQIAAKIIAENLLGLVV